MHPTDESWRIELEAGQPSHLCRPKELVLLVAVQQVVFGRSFFDGGAYRQADGDEADAVVLKRRIKSGLVVMKRRAVAEAIEGCRCHSVHSEPGKTKPSTLQREATQLLVKCEDVRIVEGIRSTACAPPPQMQLDDIAEGRAPRILRTHLVEANRLTFTKVIEAARKVFPVAWSQCAEIGIPRPSGQINKRADIRRDLNTFPFSIGKVGTDNFGESGILIHAMEANAQSGTDQE